MRRLGHWLAILAITLNAAWPLLANARPKSVHLVPICTVEGITHFLEVPGGSTPLDDSANAHHDHCSFCFLGTGALLPTHVEAPRLPASVSDRIAVSHEQSHSSEVLLVHGARAPPLSPVVNANHNIGRQSETSLFAGRIARALYS